MLYLAIFLGGILAGLIIAAVCMQRVDGTVHVFEDGMYLNISQKSMDELPKRKFVTFKVSKKNQPL